MNQSKILVFASGTPEGGGSGFEELVLASRNGSLRGEIVGVVSQHKDGGVHKRAEKLNIPFFHFQKDAGAERYQELATETEADFFALSGWLKKVSGLNLSTRFNSRTVFNIHPGPIPKFGGAGLYGRRVHEAVLEAFYRGEITHTAICMHFATEEYDRGPIFFSLEIEIKNGDTVETLVKRVNDLEHILQPKITDLVVNDAIRWDGKEPLSLIVPKDYSIHRIA